MQRYDFLLIYANNLGEIYLKWYRFRPFLSLEPFYSVLILLIGFSEAARQWEIGVDPDINVLADTVMLRQVIMNIVKNAVEAHAQRIVIEARNDMTNNRANDPKNLVYVYIGNDGHPIMAENRQSLFIPFFTTKRSGNGIGLSLSRRMMLQQGGMLELADHPFNGCHVTFILQLRMVTPTN